MAERHGSRWTEEQIERGADALEQRLDQHATWEDGAAAVLEAVFPVGEPDEQKSTEGLLNAVERLNGQKDALRRENGQLRELLDLPVEERVAAVAELARGEPDDARLVNTIRGPLEAQGLPTDDEGWAKLVRWVVAAVRAAEAEPKSTRDVAAGMRRRRDWGPKG